MTAPAVPRRDPGRAGRLKRQRRAGGEPPRGSVGSKREHPAVPARIIDIRYLKTFARLRRPNAQLALWDELDAMALMPPGLRP